MKKITRRVSGDLQYKLVLNGCLALIDSRNNGHIKLRLATFVGKETVLLLLNIGQLRVAKAHDQGVIKDRIGKAAIAQ